MIEKYSDTLLKMFWWVEDFSDTNFNLLTSDYPITFLPRHQIIKRFNTPNDALLSGAYTLALPLTPKLCFYSSSNRNNVKLTKNSLIKMQNHFTVIHSKNFVYAFDKSQDEFIRKKLRLRSVQFSRFGVGTINKNGIKIS
jgi:hypothetical protein